MCWSFNVLNFFRTAIIHPTNNMWWSECSLYKCFFSGVQTRNHQTCLHRWVWLLFAFRLFKPFMMLWVVFRCLSVLLPLHVGEHNPKRRLTCIEKSVQNLKKTRTTFQSDDNTKQECPRKTVLSQPTIFPLWVFGTAQEATKCFTTRKITLVAFMWLRELLSELLWEVRACPGANTLPRSGGGSDGSASGLRHERMSRRHGPGQVQPPL